jgi:hypothetical protein
VSGFGIRLVRHGLPGALGESDQLLRLARFKDTHPEVIIGDGGFGTMQARIPEPDGETVITRYTLGELLDTTSGWASPRSPTGSWRPNSPPSDT